MQKNFSKKIISLLFIMISIAAADAAVFYTPSEYNAVYNEKIALQLELKTLNRQYQNEKSKYENTINGLQAEIDQLKRELEQLKSSCSDRTKSFEAKIEELQNMINILKSKGSETEKNLIESNRLLQKRCEDDMEQAREKWNNEREKLLKEMADLKSDYEKRILALKDEIANLNEELSDLKKLTNKQKEELSRMESQASDLEKQLDDEIKKGDIRLKKFHNRLVINIDDKISFDSGYANLKKEILPSLKKIREILSQYPEYSIVVEGHTDNIPMRSKKFRDNWELSTERALAVLGYLLEDSNLNPVRFSAAGYGEYKPLVSNETKENRALNRRVDIVVIPTVPGQ
ncbi:MAG TPA: OmpA family protein [Spirochaetota bacterium]|nr:OmpA family protein [Spirochaetota bacterium]HPS85242.1 OmpA family protein [Spirochaetota bacterium]